MERRRVVALMIVMLILSVVGLGLGSSPITAEQGSSGPDATPAAGQAAVGNVFFPAIVGPIASGSNTPVPTATSTATGTATAISTGTATATSTPTATPTATSTATSTSTATPTATSTATATATATATKGPIAYTIAGFVQKGPFVQGTEISLRELDNNFVPTGRTFTGSIDDNTGHFSVRGTLAYPFVELAANGFYFNEVNGSLSAAPISLLALADLRDSTTINVNLLTHLERARVLALVDTGMAFSVAKAQAQQEVLVMFNLADAAIGRSETLDIAQAGEGNAILLAISVLLQSNRSEAQLTELLSALSNDLSADGVLNNIATRQALLDSMEYVKPRRAAIRMNIANRYAVLGMPATVPPFEAYVFALDVVAPAVAATLPSDGADQDVSVVTIVFSELMDHATLVSSTVSVSNASSNLVTGTLGLTDTDSETTVVFTPQSGLSPGIYQLTIDADVHDLAGNGLAAVGVGFTHTVSISGLVASSSSTTLGEVTYFTATISSGSDVTYVWEFGDGSVGGSGASITHTYSAIGYYTAIVTATNSLSSVSALRQTILFNGWTEDEILIPAGSFQMGCDSTNPAETFCDFNELPLHTVTLDAFYIDKYEVTNARYKMCVNAGQCIEPQSIRSQTRESYFDNETFADYPVINLFWEQTVDFCTWDGRRLPTEAEWEMAARGTSDTRKYPWGNSEPDCTKANASSDKWERCMGDTTQVGLYPAGVSPFGVMDMAGNVMELVNDWHRGDYYSTSPASNPPGPATGTWHVMRGGTWNFSSFFARSAHRNDATPPDYWNSDSAGFRCARTP